MSDGAATIYYEDDCGFCRKAASMVMTVFLLRKKVNMFPASFNPRAHELLMRYNSWVVGERHLAAESFYLEYEALLALMSHSPWGRYMRPIASVRPLRMVGRKVYRLIAANRPRVCT